MEYIDIFKEAHLQVVGVPFTQINGREGKSLKELFVNVALFWKEKTGESLSNEQALKAFDHFLNSIDVDYVLDNFTPSVIYQHYQLIINHAYGKRFSSHEKTVKLNNFFRRYTKEEQDEIIRIKQAYENQKNKLTQ